jgi:Spy/CpxP family protein refolding chaperone
MKRTLLMGLLTLFTAAPLIANAQTPAPTAESRQEMRIDRLAGKLGLDAASQAKLEQTFQKFRAQMAPIRQDARQTRQSLRAELSSAQPDETKVSTLTTRLQGDRQQMQAVAQQRSAELKSELTPSQYAKLVLHAHRFGRGMHRQHEGTEK